MAPRQRLFILIAYAAAGLQKVYGFLISLSAWDALDGF
jgi:hypothetical protein